MPCFCCASLQGLADILLFPRNWLSARKSDRKRAREDAAFDRMTSEIAELKRRLAEQKTHIAPVPLMRVPNTGSRSLIVTTQQEDEMAKDSTVCEMVKAGRAWLKANPSATVEDYRLKQHWAVVVKGFDVSQCARAMTELGAEFAERMQIAKS